jgi:glutamine amidotransferase
MISVAIVDTGAGNLFAVRRAIRRSGGSPRVTRDPATIRRSSLVVLPGVASFTATTRGLKGLRSCLIQRHVNGRPLLGICAGFQALASRSEEGPGRGLEIVPSTVKELRSPRRPHMGWSPLTLSPDRLWEGVGPAEPWVFFAHSYALPPQGSAVRAVAEHKGEWFAAAARWNTTVGVQFHPELSGPVGGRFLSNMMEWAEELR